MGSKEKKSKNKKIIILGIIFLLVSVSFLIWYFLAKQAIEREKNKMQIIMKDNLQAEINSEVKILSFIDKVVNGKILTKDKPLDTSKLGDQEIVLSIKDKYDEVTKYKFKILVNDTEKPVIEAKEKITSYVGQKMDLLQDVKVRDNSLEEIVATVSGDYDFNKVGEYKLKYIARDSSNNEREYEFILSVINKPVPVNKTHKGFTIKVVDGVTYIDGTLIANKTYALPSSYGSGLASSTTNAFNKMKSDATALGLNLYISSGYRSYASQNNIYNNYVKRDGKESADTYSARAGHSEHQTGLAFDLNTIDSSFANTAEGKWVADNCYQYGLIIRYPKGKDGITGYKYEPWHLRYVGIDLATKLYNNGNWITIEEYYGIDSKYK